MSHFAELDENNIVLRVLVIEQEYINTGEFGSPNTWIQTSYNTRGGKHFSQDGEEDSGVALRYNYAGKGYTYDTGRDAFIAPKPYPSWALVEATCQWESPVAYPSDGKIDGKRYFWDEATSNWVEETP